MFKGVYTPSITVFKKDGSIDWQGNEKVLHHLINKGMNGILVLGSIGEFFSLSMQEKKEFISFAIKTVAGKVPLLVGTGGTNMDEVVELTQFAENKGATAVIAISPYYFKLDEANIYRYYATVAKCVELPVLLYNFPDRTAVNFSPELVLRLALDFKNIIGIKDTVDNISHTRKLIRIVKSQRMDFSILSGFDEYLVLNLLAGGDGLIGGLSNVVPALFVDLYNACIKKDFDTVKALQTKVCILMGLYDISQPFVSSIKAAASIAGLNTGCAMRKPAEELDSEQIGRVREILNSIER
ncbi:MAG: 4-hydroxy-tetrahydrodipicolinate synthase [Clostridiaceae bacterium]|jgi:4-hydroxy-tetrahydrodipicolinate synthase|nr:4-hydroxy-tetrahydrodipicolinate synthase [Clostridiaceae bacterium]